MIAKEIGQLRSCRRAFSPIVADLEVQSRGKFAKAETVAATALGFLDGDNGTEWARFIYGVQADAKLGKGDLNAAKALIEKAFDGVDVSDTSLSYEEMHDVAYQVYQLSGDHQMALTHHESFKRLSDDATKVAASSNLALMAARFHTAEQSLNIERLKNDQLNKDMLLEDASKRQTVQAAIIAFAGVVVLFFFTVVVNTRNHRNRVASMNDKLTTTVLELNDEMVRREIVEMDLVTAKDQAEEASRMKSTFLATMSHELRTPLNGILGFSKLLLNGEMETEQRDQLEVIEQSGESLLVLINDILDLSQMEAGKLKLHNAPFNLSKTMEGAVKLLQARAQEKDLNLALHIDPALPTIVNGDSGRIRQIAVNLVGNAIKFTDKGTVALFVTPGDVEDDIKISVIDTGIGVPADKVDDLFDRFFQVDGSTSRKFSGTGLGLSICKELVDAMDGEIGVDTVYGEGSEFWFHVPLAAASDITVLPNAGARRVRQQETVLVVENDRIKQKIFSAMLPTMNLVPVIVETAASGVAVLASMKSSGKKLSAVVVGGELTDMPAADFARYARENALCEDAVLVLCSAASFTDEAVASMGFDRRIDQPLTLNAIFAGLSLNDQAANCETQSNKPHASEGAVVKMAKRTCLARALVVDDNATNRLLMSKVMLSFGVDVIVAENGRDAVALTRNGNFDMVFMDIHMPVMDGMEATRRIRALGGDFMTLPIIALTALAMPGDRESFLEAGMDDYISKPIDIADLRSRVLSIMDEKTTQPSTRTDLKRSTAQD